MKKVSLAINNKYITIFKLIMLINHVQNQQIIMMCWFKDAYICSVALL